MKRIYYLLALALCALPAVGCGYEDPRPDPTKQPGFVDTSDPSVLLGQQAEEREAQSKGK